MDIKKIKKSNISSSYLTLEDKLLFLNKTDEEIGKIIFARFNKEYENLDPKDPNWTIEFIDNNSKNLSLNNLKYKNISLVQEKLK